MRLKMIIIAFALVLLSIGNSHAQDFSSSDKECLTKAIYHEARGESDKGMFAVAAVILNRVDTEGFPDDVCSVIHQRGQFTFDKKKKMSEQSALQKVQSIVSAIEANYIPNLPFLYFHRKDVFGPCTNKRHVTIGNHVFCS